jgi:RNA polymerase subunit RPABC4/transcription elongation factor Spt4
MAHLEILSTQPEKIICPNCNSIEDAEVQLTNLWPIYIHECSECKYLIQESEWNKTDRK